MLVFHHKLQKKKKKRLTKQNYLTGSHIDDYNTRLCYDGGLVALFLFFEFMI